MSPQFVQDWLPVMIIGVSFLIMSPIIYSAYKHEKKRDDKIAKLEKTIDELKAKK